jgi:ParB family transcriptional regulator, chromosome partitioning protein
MALQAEIDENLIRNELTALDKGLQMARRKAIYLELYPETRHGGDRKNQSAKNQDDTVSFCQDTAAKTQQSKRTVERNVAIGEALGDLQDEIRDAGSLTSSI